MSTMYDPLDKPPFDDFPPDISKAKAAYWLAYQAATKKKEDALRKINEEYDREIELAQKKYAQDVKNK